MVKKIIMGLCLLATTLFGEVTTKVVNDNPYKKAGIIKLDTGTDKKIDLSVKKINIIHIRETDTENDGFGLDSPRKIPKVKLFIPEEPGDVPAGASADYFKNPTEFMVVAVDNVKKLPGKVLINGNEVEDENAKSIAELQKTPDSYKHSPLTIANGIDRTRLIVNPEPNLTMENIFLKNGLAFKNGSDFVEKQYRNVWMDLHPDLVDYETSPADGRLLSRKPKAGYEEKYKTEMRLWNLTLELDMSRSKESQGNFTATATNNGTREEAHVTNPLDPWYDVKTAILGVYRRVTPETEKFGVDATKINNISMKNDNDNNGYNNTGKWELVRVYQWDKPGYNIRNKKDDDSEPWGTKLNARPDFPKYVGAALPGELVKLNSDWRTLFPEWQINNGDLKSIYNSNYTIRVGLISGVTTWNTRYDSGYLKGYRRQVADNFEGLAYIEGGQIDQTGIFFRDDDNTKVNKNNILLTHEFEVQTFLGGNNILNTKENLKNIYNESTERVELRAGNETGAFSGATDYTGWHNPGMYLIHVAEDKDAHGEGKSFLDRKLPVDHPYYHYYNNNTTLRELLSDPNYIAVKGETNATVGNFTFYSKSYNGAALGRSYLDEATSVYELFKIFLTGTPKPGLYTYRRGESDKKVVFWGYWQGGDVSGYNTGSGWNINPLEPASFKYNNGKFWFLIQRPGIKSGNIPYKTLNTDLRQKIIPVEELDNRFDYGINVLGKQPVGMFLKVQERVKPGQLLPNNFMVDGDSNIIIDPSTKTGYYDLQILAQVKVDGKPADYLQRTSKLGKNEIARDPDIIRLWYTNASPDMTARIDLYRTPNGTEITWEVPKDTTKDPVVPQDVNSGDKILAKDISVDIPKPYLEVFEGKWWDIWDRAGKSQLNMVLASKSHKSTEVNPEDGDGFTENGTNEGFGKLIDYSDDGFSIRFLKDGRFIVKKTRGNFLKDRFYNFKFLANENATEAKDPEKELKLGALTLQVRGERPLLAMEYETVIDGRLLAAKEWFQLKGGAGNNENNLKEIYKPFMEGELLNDKTKLPPGVTIQRWVAIADTDLSKLEYQTTPGGYKLRQPIAPTPDRGATRFGKLVGKEFGEEGVGAPGDVTVILPTITGNQRDLDVIANEIIVKKDAINDLKPMCIVFEGSDGKYYSIIYSVRSNGRRKADFIYETDLNEYEINIPYKYSLKNGDNFNNIISSSSAAVQRELEKITGSLSGLAGIDFSHANMNDFKIEIGPSHAKDIATPKYKVEMGLTTSPSGNSGVNFKVSSTITRLNNAAVSKSDFVTGKIFYLDIPLVDYKINLFKSEYIEGDVYLKVSDDGSATGDYLWFDGLRRSGINFSINPGSKITIDMDRSTFPDTVIKKDPSGEDIFLINNGVSSFVKKDKNMSSERGTALYVDTTQTISLFLERTPSKLFDKLKRMIINTKNLPINSGKTFTITYEGIDGKKYQANVYVEKDTPIPGSIQNEYVMSIETLNATKDQELEYDAKEAGTYKDKFDFNDKKGSSIKLNTKITKYRNIPAYLIPSIDAGAGLPTVIHGAGTNISAGANGELKIIKPGYYEILISKDNKFKLKKLTTTKFYTDKIVLEKGIERYIINVVNETSTFTRGSGVVDISNWSAGDYASWGIENGIARIKFGNNSQIINSSGEFPILTDKTGASIVSKIEVKVERLSVTSNIGVDKDKWIRLDNNTLLMGVYGENGSHNTSGNITINDGQFYIQKLAEGTQDGVIYNLSFYKRKADGTDEKYGEYDLKIVNYPLNILIEGNDVIDFGYVENTIPQPSNGVVLQDVTKTEEFKLKGIPAGRNAHVSLKESNPRIILQNAIGVTLGSDPLAEIPIKDIKVIGVGIDSADNTKYNFKVKATAIIKPKLKTGVYKSYDKNLEIKVRITSGSGSN